MSLPTFANDVMDIMPPSNDVCDHDSDEVEIAVCTSFSKWKAEGFCG